MTKSNYRKFEIMKRVLLIFGIFLVATSGFSNDMTDMKSFIDGLVNPVLSPNLKELAFSKEDYSGLYLYEFEKDTIITIATNPGAGYGANFSGDGRFIAFKLILQDGSQQPVCFDVKNKKIIKLHSPVIAAGVPTFSNDQSIAYTVGAELIIVDNKLNLIRRIDLGYYANLAPISPDGSSVVYNDKNDQLWIISLDNGSKFQLTNSPDGFFNPHWSPDSRKIAANSLSGDIVVFDIDSHQSYRIGKGTSINWLEDNKNILYCELEWNKRFQLEKSQLIITDFTGENRAELGVSSNSQILFCHYVPEQNRIVYVFKKNLIIHQIKRLGQRVEISDRQIISVDRFGMIDQPEAPAIRLDYSTDQMDVVSFEAPYFHQVYDTPDWFDGHWACGATSAMMALTYYNILSPMPCSCSYPYPHESSHGRYICEIYSFNGYTYNIGGYDPNGRLGYGGYGFIIQNNWADTKGNMAKYARQHGLGSFVDWSPTYSKLKANINEAFPVVILNSLTNAGHYILGIGYNNSQHSVILNDPYGNKNQGYMNYNGKNVVYDWPGYNSGHANLNIVHCLIYMREGCDLVVDDFKLADTLSVNEEVDISFKIYNIGSEPSDAFSVQLYLSSDRDINSNTDYLLKEIPVSGVGKNDSLIIETMVQIPDSLPSFRWWLGVYIDIEDVILENSEENNSKLVDFILKGYPYVYRFKPIPSSIIETLQPEISARFIDVYFGIITDSARLYLDGKDLTSSCGFEGNKIYYNPEQALAPTQHWATIEVVNNLGYKTIKNWNFQIVKTGVSSEAESLADRKYVLASNYPNPFNSRTRITYQLAKAGWVTLKIYSLTGQLIKVLVNEFQQQGSHQCHWDGKDRYHRIVPSGLYLYQLAGNNFVKTRRMIFLK